MCFMFRSAQLLCGFAWMVEATACDFPRPADVGGDVVPGDAGGDTGGAPDGGEMSCTRVGFPSSPWPSTSSFQIVPVDLNNDQKLDLVTTHQSTIGILRGNGMGAFQPEVE